jgi:dTDP-glucose 4,6-dehydratase
LKANEKELLLVIDGIVNGTWHTLDFACHCKAKKVLLTSSGAIYGKQPSDIDFIPEDYKGAPDTVQSCSAYGHAKRFSESLCAMYADQFGIQTKIARCFTFMGPYMPLNASFAIGNFVLDGLRGEALRVKGDGSPYRSYMYAGDLAIWLWTILFKGKTCFPYNVGSDEAVTISDLADIVSQQFEQRPRIQIEQANVIGLAGERYIPSIERARSELGLIPMIGLTEAVQRTIDWFREIVNQPGENRCW